MFRFWLRIHGDIHNRKTSWGVADSLIRGAADSPTRRVGDSPTRRVSDLHGFNADPDPAFFLIADPDPDPGSGFRIQGLMA